MFVQTLVEPLQPLQGTWLGGNHRRHAAIGTTLAGQTGMTPKRQQLTGLNQPVVETVAGAVALVVTHIVHDHLSPLTIEIIAAGIAVSCGRIEQLTLHTLATGHQEQTAFLIVDDEGTVTIARLTLVETLQKQTTEGGIETQVVLYDERSLQLVVKDVLRSQQMLIGTAGSWEHAMHGIRLAVVDEVTVENVRRQVRHVAIKDIMTGKGHLFQLFLDERLALFLTPYVYHKYLDFRHAFLFLMNR